MDVDRDKYRFHGGAYISVRKHEMKVMTSRFGNVSIRLKRAKGGFRRRGRKNRFSRMNRR